MGKLSSIFSKADVTFFKPLEGLPNEFVGIEIETENNGPANIAKAQVPRPRIQFDGLDPPVRAYKPKQELKYWDAKEDHSLRNNGVEYLTKTPISGVAVKEAIEEFVKFANKQGLEHSLRTAIHIHVNMSNVDDDLEVLRQFFFCYFLIEDALFNWSGAWRKHTGYCVPLYESLPYLDKWGAFLKHPTEKSIIEATHGVPRYSALNIAALTRHGTVEIRLFPTVYEEQVIFDWVKACLCIKEAALKAAKNRTSLLDKASNCTLNEFCTDVFGERLGENIAAFTNANEVQQRLVFLNSLCDQFTTKGSVAEDIDDGEWVVPGLIKKRSSNRYPLISKMKEKFRNKQDEKQPASETKVRFE